MEHWTITRDPDGLAWLTFDKAGATTNTLSAAVLAELNEALDQLDREPPKGLVIRSGKANGFIAGADVAEFSEVKDEAGAIAIVKRGWDAFERLAHVKYPTLALVRGFCLGGGLELALACRYRVVVDEPGTRLGLAGSDAGHRAGLGRHPAPAAAHRRARPRSTCCSRARRSTRGGRRSSASRTSACRRGSRRTRSRGVLRALPRAASARDAAVADAQSARAPLHRGAGRESRSPSARAASTIRPRTRSSTCG